MSQALLGELTVLPGTPTSWILWGHFAAGKRGEGRVGGECKVRERNRREGEKGRRRMKADKAEKNEK